MNAYIYAGIAIALLASGFATGDHWGAAGPEKALATLKAQQATAVAQQQATYAADLAKQLKDYQNTTANNQKVMTELQSENATVSADRDFARRLLNAARAAPAPTHSATGTGPGGGPVASAVPQNSGDGSLVGLIGGATGECRDAMQRLAGLQDEIIPQLKVGTP